MNRNRDVLIVIALFALAGLSAATYVFLTHSLGYELYCPFATGCDTVQNSPYAVLFGIPVSFLGMLGFTAYIALALIGLRSGAAARGYLHSLLVLSVVEVGFTSYMAYLQVAVIRAICSWCMLSAALTVALAVLVIYAIFGRAKSTSATLGGSVPCLNGSVSAGRRKTSRCSGPGPRKRWSLAADLGVGREGRAARGLAGPGPGGESQAMVEFPKEITLKDGTKVTLKPMTSRDREGLHAFFARLSEEDTKFLKDDVRKPEVVEAWCRDINYGRVFPLLAEVEGDIVADATLHRRIHGWLKHVGEVRFVVDPASRRKGLGAHLIEELILYAMDQGLEKLVAEVVDEEVAALRALERFGLQRVATVPGLVKDKTGTYRDLHTLVLDLGTAYLPDWYYF